MRVYHVTPVSNIKSIFELGINPIFAKGENKRCWYVGEDRVLWAIVHVSAKFELSVDRLMVYCCEVRSHELRKFRKDIYSVGMLIAHREKGDIPAIDSVAGWIVYTIRASEMAK